MIPHPNYSWLQSRPPAPTLTKSTEYQNPEKNEPHFGLQYAVNDTRFIILEPKVFQDSLTIDLFLHAHASGGQHGQTTIIQLLGLHIGKVLGLGRL